MSAAAALAATAALAAPAGAAVSGTHVIATLPDTSGLELTAYPHTTTLAVSLVRDGVTIATGSVLTDNAGDGAINGGSTDCWTGVTPDILPGDEVHVVGAGFDDSMIVQGVSAAMPVKTAPDTVVVHGAASDPQGNQLPVSGVEARITSKTLFSNGRRLLRAGAGQLFSLSYDTPAGAAWTATFSGLSAGDVALATNPLESRGVFTNAGLNESTISQTPAAPGPTPPCTAPLLRDAVTSSRPSAINIAHAGQDLVLSGIAQDATAVSVSLDDADPATAPLHATGTLSGVGTQTWTATVPAAAVAGLSQGTLTATPTFTVAAGTIGGASLAVLKDLTAPGAPTASPPPGAGPFHAPQAVSLSSSDATARIHWTSDGTTPDATSPLLAAGSQIAVSASQTIRAVAIDPADNAGPVATFDYTILSPGSTQQPASGGTTIVQQVPFLLPLLPGQAVRSATATSRPAVHGLSVAVLRGHALRVVMRLGRGAGVVRLQVLRAGRGPERGRPVLSTLRLPSAGGLYAVTLRGHALRALRAGRYVVEARAGASPGVYGAPARAGFTVHAS